MISCANHWLNIKGVMRTRMSPCYRITSIRMEQDCRDDWMSINPNKKGVDDRKGMIQRLVNARNPKKKGKKEEKV